MHKATIKPLEVRYTERSYVAKKGACAGKTFYVYEVKFTSDDAPLLQGGGKLERAEIAEMSNPCSLQVGESYSVVLRYKEEYKKWEFSIASKGGGGSYPGGRRYGKSAEEIALDREKNASIERQVALKEAVSFWNANHGEFIDTGEKASEQVLLIAKAFKTFLHGN